MAKILVAERKQPDFDFLKQYLLDGGFEVASSETGDALLEKLGQDPCIDVIILGTGISCADGRDILQHLRASEFYVDIPVIRRVEAVSASQSEEGVEMDFGYHYLPEPCTASAALAAVHAALKDRRVSAEAHERVRKQRRMLAMMEQGVFAFRTLEEANDLSYFIASCFPNPERAVYGLNELMINAVEHGNLGITYKEKAELLFSGEWQAEVERRLLQPRYRHKYATLSYETGRSSLRVSIRDQGEGFDWRGYLELSPERAYDPNGRGIALVRMRSFPLLEYKGSGNEVVCTVLRQARPARADLAEGKKTA
jgi:CheY-like chemotaxis protein